MVKGVIAGYPGSSTKPEGRGGVQLEENMGERCTNDVHGGVLILSLLFD